MRKGFFIVGIIVWKMTHVNKKLRISRVMGYIWCLDQIKKWKVRFA